MKYRRRVFAQRPGDVVEGVADRPTLVLGVDVQHVILVRPDAPAALVRLVDQRFAITGTVVAVGCARDLGAYARRRALRCLSRADRGWFGVCAQHLAAAHPDAGGPVRSSS